MKKYLISAVLLSTLLPLSNNALAVDWSKFFGNMFTTAGSKSVDNDEGKNIEKFLNKSCTGTNPWGQPFIQNEKLMKRSLFLCRTMYGVQYDSVYKTPLWVTEVLEKDNVLKAPPVGISYPAMQLDPDLPRNMQFTLADYKGTGYEPFLVAPPADLFIYRTNIKDEELLAANKNSLEEGSYASNVMPIASGLKKGLWQQLELQTRALLVTRNMVYVITGPIYLNGQTKGTIGKNGVPIPTHLFKVIVNPDTNGSLTYIIPNQDILTPTYRASGKNVFTCNGGPCELDNFIAPLKEVEKATGFTLFPKLAPAYATKVKLDVNELNKKQQ